MSHADTYMVTGKGLNRDLILLEIAKPVQFVVQSRLLKVRMEFGMRWLFSQTFTLSENSMGTGSS